MWQVITRAAHCMHLTIAGKTVEHGASRADAKTVLRDEYGPGPHRDGLPETLEVRRVLRAHRHLLNLRGLSKHPGQQQAIAVQQLMDALRQDGKNCPRVSLACSLVRGNPTEGNIALGLTITEAALTAAREQERAGKRDKWHGSKNRRDVAPVLSFDGSAMGQDRYRPPPPNKRAMALGSMGRSRRSRPAIVPGGLSGASPPL